MKFKTSCTISEGCSRKFTAFSADSVELDYIIRDLEEVYLNGNNIRMRVIHYSIGILDCDIRKECDTKQLFVNTRIWFKYAHKSIIRGGTRLPYLVHLRFVHLISSHHHMQSSRGSSQALQLY